MEMLEGNNVSEQLKAEAAWSCGSKYGWCNYACLCRIFLRHHIHEAVKDPLELWNKLKERYEHLKAIILPNARYNWMHLRLQDFKSEATYNSEVCKITSQLKLCGDKVADADLLEKTFSTFHASNVLLQQQYQEKGFKKYSDFLPSSC
jgi:hypothetical protein